MAIVYVWNVSDMDYNADDGGVTAVYWRCKGIDAAEDVAASVFGSTAHTPNASDESFIALEDLDEETVLEWVWASIVRSDIESDAADRISAELSQEASRNVNSEEAL